MATKDFKIEVGEQRAIYPSEPIIGLVGSEDGGEPYLWIGNNSNLDKKCFATLGDQVALKKLATAILSELEKVKSKT